MYPLTPHVHSLLSFSHCFGENCPVFLDLLPENHRFILPPLADQLQIGFQLSAEVRLGHLIAHGVITCGKSSVLCGSDSTTWNLSDRAPPSSLQPLPLPSTSPMPRCPGRNRLSGVSPTYIRALIVSMCSACVASVPESHSSDSVSPDLAPHHPVGPPSARIAYSLHYSSMHSLDHMETTTAPSLSLTPACSLTLSPPARTLRLKFPPQLSRSHSQSPVTSWSGHPRLRFPVSPSTHPLSPLWPKGAFVCLFIFNLLI